MSSAPNEQDPRDWKVPRRKGRSLPSSANPDVILATCFSFCAALLPVANKRSGDPLRRRMICQHLPEREMGNQEGAC